MLEPMPGGRIESVISWTYKTFLAEHYRTPSRGGNSGAWHSHVLYIGDERYAFLALGQRKWAYAGDTISFEWVWAKTGKHRDIVLPTFATTDKNGAVVRRGDRGFKVWRTAEQRAPVSRREWRS